MMQALRRWTVLVSVLVIHGLVQPQTLPPTVAAALTRAKVPPEAISLLVVNADGQSTPRLSHRAEVPMNPASVTKLLTTTAALDLLGPSFVWRTPVWLDGPVKGGVLKGNLVIQGQGDPKLVLEKLWLLLRRVQGLGVQSIDGNIVLDRSAFAVVPVNPAEFDGEPLRPYNASPDALLINYKSVLLTFTPDPANAVARVQIDPPLASVQVPATVPLQKPLTADCGDYRQTLKANFSDAAQIRLAGSYAVSCGEKVWPVAYSDPASYNARSIAGLWRSMGGQLSGSVLDGVAPATPATFEVTSPPLAEVIRDINKFSNNVMAEQLFLTLGRATAREVQPAPVTPEAAREVLRQWWLQRVSPMASTTTQTLPVPVIDNGSGLSRQTRLSAQGLTRLLQMAYASPYGAELMSSLPIAGIDGTLKRSQATSGSAHLKTGSLHGVLALAGYVHGAQGQAICLVALVNHANASAARAALDALIDWTLAESAKR
jgi:D-alanyl-D-alanine carboxypeptidase/D-alanyl-D-alanine-endopeptidase (penicillin-binding protein 4)